MCVVVGIIVIVIGLLLAALAKARSSATSVNCISNLRQITTAFRVSATENGNHFPNPGASDTTWEAVLAKYLTDPRVLQCPSDGEIYPAVGSSYDWRDTGLPESTLAGKLVDEVGRADTVVTLEALPGWHKKKMMNVGRFDGSCVTMDAEEALGDLLKSIK
jgi:hypothetical protein